MCLYVNETLPHINSSLFAVNQMLSVWDSQCQIEGIPDPGILQVRNQIALQCFVQILVPHTN